MQRSDTQRKLGWLYFRVLAPLVLVVAAVSALSVASVHVLGAVRAYVGGESRWSKARSLAVQALRDYAASHDPADLARYHAALAVPQGDRQAREQLSQPMPDMARVQQGFLQGENHPEDIAAMVQLFRRLSWLPVFHQALNTWTHADALIAQLQMQAAMLSSQVKGADLAGQQRTLTHIQQIDRDLLQTENAFSARLAEASRQTVMALTLGITLSAILLTLTSGWLIHRSLRRQHAQHLAQAELADWGHSPDFFFALGDLLLDWAAEQPALAPELIPMIEEAWQRCLALGEHPEHEGAVRGRGSHLAAGNLALLYDLVGRPADAAHCRQLAAQR